MEFGSGVLAHVQLSWLDPHKERKLTVVGAQKMVVFDDMEAREKLRIYDKGVERPPEYGSYGEALSIREGDIFIPRIPTVEPLAAELSHFVRVARGTEPPRASADDGVRVVRVLEAASRSLARGGAPEVPCPPLLLCRPQSIISWRTPTSAPPSLASWALAQSACPSRWQS